MVKIDSPIQADRVRRRKPPYIRIIVAEGVVVKPGFPVQVLALVAYVVPRDLAGLAGFSEGVAPDLVVHAPDDFSLLVGQLFGRALSGQCEFNRLGFKESAGGGNFCESLSQP